MRAGSAPRSARRLLQFPTRRGARRPSPVSLFNVFIERPRSTAVGAVAALARAIGERYGIPIADLEARLAAGRFRVKGNVDRATADSYAHDLARLGAICTIVSVDAAPATSVPAVTLPRVERTPAPAPASTRPSQPSWPPPDLDVAQELGALSGEHPLTLSTLDGATEDEARASRKLKLPATFAPPESAASASRKVPLPASFGPPPDDDDDSADVNLDDSSPAVEVFDPFAPPEAQADAPELMLATDTKPRTSKPISTTPPPVATAAPLPPPIASTQGRTMHEAPPTIAPIAPPAAAPSSGPGWKGALRDDGVRLIVGVVLAVALGALPALLIGASRERAAFAEIDGQLDKRQSEIRTVEAWEGLDRVRATFRERKEAERQTIAITSLLIWAAIGGGFAWLWFRVIDWRRVLA